ncbi:MAG: ATP-binding protein [Kofleriaceae bacterium]
MTEHPHRRRGWRGHRGHPHHRHWNHQHWQHEREMWMTHPHRSRWLPWWLQSRLRRRVFTWLAVVGGVAFWIGHRIEQPRWWWLAIGAAVLSMISGTIAWRMSRPLLVAVRVAKEIGEGNLETRLDVHHHDREMRILATAINEMAERIQQQLSDQRQLLAAVSHELRTPLGHMRVLIETARDTAGTNNPRAFDELEREVLTLDDLVGKLLASSRLEFGTLDRHDVDLGQLVTDVVTAGGVPPEAIDAAGDVQASVDPTLIRRAVANLIDNARVHGSGAIAVRIERRGGQVAIEVDDAGPGVPADRRADAFRAFVPSTGGGLGLGLALVSRIAVAHGGGAWISERPGGGARVGFTVGVSAPE